MLENNVIDYGEIARGVLAEDPLFLDTETTGLYGDAEVVELAIANAQGDILFESLIRPSHPIPPDATAIHHITDAMVKNAPTWPDVHDTVVGLVTGRSLVIYNAAFDLDMLRQTASKYKKLWPNDLRVFCLMRFYASYYGDWSSYFGNFVWQKLSAAAIHLQVPAPATGQLHRAAYDCLLSVGVLRAIGYGCNDERLG
jgi:DNA polymerase-3 subunit epsilon